MTAVGSFFPIDSGILSSANLADEETNLTVRALAHQMGIPLRILTDNYLSLVRDTARDVGLSPAPGGDGLAYLNGLERSDLPRLSEMLRRLRGSKSEMPCQFPHPLYRYLKDHIVVRMYEALMICELSPQVGDDIVFRSYVLPGVGFSIFAKRTTKGLLVAGPMFLDEGASYGADHAYFDRFSQALRAFITFVEAFNARLALNAPTNSVLYTHDHLLRAAFSRQKLTRGTAETKLRLACRCLQQIELLGQQPFARFVTPTFFAKLTATLVATDVGQRDGYLKFKTFSDLGGPKVNVLGISNGKWQFYSDKAPEPSADFESRYAQASEIAYANWNTYIVESLFHLKNWLTTNRISASGDDALQEKTNFGRRLARYLGHVFGAHECNIYRLSHIAQGLSLNSVGAFSTEKEGDTRLALMQEHMDTLTRGSSQNRSISFRCAINNKIQYCQYFSYDPPGAYPEDQPMVYPPGTPFEDWGTSACSLPIRVNGRLWGVLQFIGHWAHAFPDISRARAEEACSIIGSHLFQTDLLSSIKDINQIISDAQLTTTDKRTRIEGTLAKMFGSKTFAIVRLDSTDELRPLNVFLQSGREDLLTATRSVEDSESLRPLLEFAKSNESTWSAVIGSEKFRGMFAGVHRRKFYESSNRDFVFLYRMPADPAADGDAPSIVMLTYDHEMVEQDNWRETVEFICQYIATVTGTLYSSALWEIKLRKKIGHELTKTALGLKGSIGRLTRQEGAAARHLIPAVIGDLTRHSGALDRFSKILTKNRDVSDFENDARLYLLDQMRAAYLSDDRNRKPANFGEVYNSAFFGQSERFAEHKLTFSELDPRLSVNIEMDEFSLNEVVATLVDNILKYAREGTSVLLNERGTTNVFGIRISNIGLRLDPDEVDLIFKDNERGHRARDRYPTEGSGFGLWYARRAMQAWGFGLTHNQRPLTEDSDSFAWHDFTLCFTKRMVSK